jgi:segregation and condensation protein B
MNPDELLRHLESLLFVAAEPAEITHLAGALNVAAADVESAVEELAERSKWRGVRVQRRGQRVQLASAPEAAPYVETFLGLSATTRLSQAALETLAIIAYRQPITRAEIEVLRGVDCDGVLRTLTARQLITEVGRLDTVGHPIRYGTTFEFLRYFGLERLEQMPSLQPPPDATSAPSGGLEATVQGDATHQELTGHETRISSEGDTEAAVPADSIAATGVQPDSAERTAGRVEERAPGLSDEEILASSDRSAVPDAEAISVSRVAGATSSATDAEAESGVAREPVRDDGAGEAAAGQSAPNETGPAAEAA